MKKWLWAIVLSLFMFLNITGNVFAGVPCPPGKICPSCPTGYCPPGYFVNARGVYNIRSATWDSGGTEDYWVIKGDEVESGGVAGFNYTGDRIRITVLAGNLDIRLYICDTGDNCSYVEHWKHNYTGGGRATSVWLDTPLKYKIFDSSTGGYKLKLKVNNIGSAPITWYRTEVEDNTYPVLAYKTDPPLEGGVITHGTVKFSVSATDASATTIYCKVSEDGGFHPEQMPNACESSTTKNTTFYYYAEDAFAHITPLTSISFGQIDNSAPEANVFSVSPPLPIHRVQLL